MRYDPHPLYVYPNPPVLRAEVTRFDSITVLDLVYPLTVYPPGGFLLCVEWRCWQLCVKQGDGCDDWQKVDMGVWGPTPDAVQPVVSLLYFMDISGGCWIVQTNLGQPSIPSPLSSWVCLACQDYILLWSCNFNAILRTIGQLGSCTRLKQFDLSMQSSCA